MSEYKDFQVGQRVQVNQFYGVLRQGVDPMGTVVNIDPPTVKWPIELAMDDTLEWGEFPAPFDPEELDIV